MSISVLTFLVYLLNPCIFAFQEPQLKQYDFTFDFKLKYDPRREVHKSVSDADISSLYSSLHKLSQTLSSLLVFQHLNRPIQAVRNQQLMQVNLLRKMVILRESVLLIVQILPVTNLLLLNNAHEDKVAMKFGQNSAKVD